MLPSIEKALNQGKTIIKIKSITGVDFASLSFSVFQKFQQPLILLAEEAKTARYIYKELREINSENIFYLEPKEEIDVEVYAHDNDVTRSRLKTLYQMATNPNSIFIMPENAFNQPIMSKSHFISELLEFRIGANLNFDKISEKLINLGYQREIAVEGEGQFSIRGGILDFSSINGNFRIELFGDEIDNIREFDISTQRSTNKINKCIALPAKELEEISKVTDYFENSIILAYNTCQIKEQELLYGSDASNIEQLAEQIRIRKSEKKERKAAPKPKDAESIISYSDLNEGDFVVHQVHGIAKFLGIKSLEISGLRADYLELAFAGTDKMFIPVSQMDMVFKYIGKDDSQIKLSRLGGSDWKSTKARVKKACQDIAEQLIALYTARQSIDGKAFSADTPWQTEFEETFEYEETDDQLRAIDEVKADMEAPRPMDRLLCGDVGYGKTEVAMRAAFKAVIDGMQVAYLCPTTVLAYQHFETFTKRMQKFGVRIELLSRFKTPTEQKKIIQKLINGEIDIVIGTHRLLQKDVKFKNLGLLIVDEEQRFGVTHKERIKELKTNVDVLTLTATPIPRTLHMSLVGIRDMSTLSHPPRDRYPVSTYVLEYNEEVIERAILKEIARGGQVYYLHNRIETIYRTAAKISELSPDITVAIAHGQMKEHELENIMMRMEQGEIDVLICTTIIETGLDIPNVNTIIIENADRMGLSQLYQLRGRVGRSNRLAHAYLTYVPDKIVSDVAQKRLNAIAQFTEFGSGFKIALRDLEIRGAGNLVGAEQHGHMDAIGYDLYCKFLSEAVDRLKNSEVNTEDIHDDEETLINVPVNAYIPHDYIEGENYRLEMYKRISNVQNNEDIIDVTDELNDRYGKVPTQVENLIKVANLKFIAEELNIAEIRFIQPEFPGGLPKYLFKMKKSAGDNFTIQGNNAENINNIDFLLQHIKTLKNYF